MDELELSVRCSRGDRLAYKELYNTYADLLLGIGYRYVGDADIANDLLHDGFIKIFTSINTFHYRDKGSLRAWMTRIMVNTALEYLRKNKKLDYMDDMEKFDESENDFDEQNFRSVPEEIILKFVTELSPTTRSVFNLHIFEDMTHSEIGRFLGIKETASRMRLNRARKELSEKINNYVRR